MMVSLRSFVLAAAFGVLAAAAAQAQGNGPGFHAAANFGGGCAGSLTTSVALAPATAGPVTVPCVSGSATAASEAGHSSLRASGRSEHVCCGTSSASNGRARIQLENIVITGPTAASIPVSINFRLQGTVTSHPQFGQAGVLLFLALRGFNTNIQSTSAVDMNDQGIYNQTGIFAPLSLGFPSAAISGQFVTPVANVTPNTPLRLDLELMAYSDMAGLGATESDFLADQNGLALPFGIPVFNLPPGYTVSIPEMNILNNFVAVPSMITGDLYVVGTNASEISLGTVTHVTGNVAINDNIAASSIDLSALDIVDGNVSIDDNTAASSINLGELDIVSGNVSIAGNTAASGIDLSELDIVGGTVSIDGNTAASSIDLGSLTVVGAVTVSDNDAMVSLDLSSLPTASGNVTVNDNDAMVSLNLSSLSITSGNVTVNDNDAVTIIDLDLLQSVGGNVSIEGNDAVTIIDLDSLQSVGDIVITGNDAVTIIDLDSLQSIGANFNVSSNGPCTSVTAGSLATVAGDLTVESCGTGDFTVGPVAPGGNASVSTSGYDSVAGTTAAGTNTISNATADARITVQLQASTFVAPTTFSLTRLSPPTLLPEVGVVAGGAAALIDPIAAYQITFGVPTLNRDATLNFDVFLAGLDSATATALLNAVTDGSVTLVTRSDAAGSEYQAFPICADTNEPTPDGCVLVQLLDPNGQPTVGTPAIVRFVGVVGHFSTWGVALVSQTSTPSFAFNGLLAPYPAPPHDATPTFQRGSVVPLKFAWVDGAGVSVDSTAAAPVVRIYSVSCSSLAPSGDPITPEDAGGSGGLRYDAEQMLWIFNWSTRPLSAGCYSIEVTTTNTSFSAPTATFPAALRAR